MKASCESIQGSAWCGAVPPQAIVELTFTFDDAFDQHSPLDDSPYVQVSDGVKKRGAFRLTIVKLRRNKLRYRSGEQGKRVRASDANLFASTPNSF